MKNSSKCRYLLLQVHCRTEDVAGGVSSDAKAKLDWLERNPKPRNEWREANGGIPLLTDLCLAMRSDPLGVIRGLGEFVICIYGAAVTYVFPDPRGAAYRN